MDRQQSCHHPPLPGRAVEANRIRAQSDSSRAGGDDGGSGAWLRPIEAMSARMRNTSLFSTVRSAVRSAIDAGCLRRLAVAAVVAAAVPAPAFAQQVAVIV